MSLFLWIALAMTAPSGAPPEYCRLSGAVFFEEVAAFADYRVYVEEYESFADMAVFLEEQPQFATEAGHWYITAQRAEADFIIYKEPVRNFAQFSIAFTPYRSAAGCRN